MFVPTEMQEGISEALARLQGLETSSGCSPAMIVLPPDSGKFIIGNSGGFVHLAIAALKASQGEPQPFKGASWVGEDELDWSIGGLQPDPEAHLYLAPTPTHWQRTMGYVLPLLVTICLAVGVVSIIRWIVQLLRHW